MSEPKSPAAQPKYSFKNGATQIIHPFYGVSAPITIDHLNGPHSDAFIKALKKLKPEGWFEKNIEVK